MKWSCGLTTTPARRSSLLPQTVLSLAEAGFDDILIAVDGCDEPSAYTYNYVTCRKLWSGNFANWYLTACEIYLRDPFADAYAMFEDDLIIARGARQYLEDTMRAGGYYNMYTAYDNAPRAGLNGWFQSAQRGMGALALAFKRDEFIKLLRDPDILFHANDVTPDRGRRRGEWCVDAVIVTVLNKYGVSELCHWPSLVEHVGVESTLGNAPYRQVPAVLEIY